MPPLRVTLTSQSNTATGPEVPIRGYRTPAATTLRPTDPQNAGGAFLTFRMPQPTRSRVNEFIADVCRLSARLEQMSRRENAECLATILQSSRQEYVELIQRKDAVKLSADDSEMVQTMLERIKARLRFLS